MHPCRVPHVLAEGLTSRSPLTRIAWSLWLVLLTVTGAIAQRAREYGLYEMVRIDDSTFIDIKEVAVADMMAFEMDDRSLALPDPAVVHELPYGPLFYGALYGQPRAVKGWAKDYVRVSRSVPQDSVNSKTKRYRAERYMEYPIAGISYEQAVAYCAWRTSQQNSYRRVKGMVVFELPTREEYERLLSIRDSTNGRCPLFNFGCPPCHDQGAGKYAFIHPGSELAPVDGYTPNDKGIFNLHGNAAEMTSTRGVAKGGSFAHAARQAAPDAEQHYNGPEAWLGFRCVARIRTY